MCNMVTFRKKQLIFLFIERSVVCIGLIFSLSFSSTLRSLQIYMHNDCFIIGPDKEILFASNFNYFLPISLNMCFGCSKEPSH